MHGAAPDDVLVAMQGGLSVQVANREEAVAVLEYQDCSAEGTWHL